MGELLINVIITIISGIVFGFFGIWLAKKYKSKHGITIIDRKFFPLLTTFKDRIHSLNFEIEIPPNQNIYYYQLSVFNSGDNDIDKSKIFEPLEFEFGDHLNVREIFISKKEPDNLQIITIVNKNVISTSWDILKPGEYYTLDMLVESGEVVEQFKQGENLNINHRITDIARIKKMNLSSIPLSSPLKLVWKKTGTIISVLCLGFLSVHFMVNVIRSFIVPDIEIHHVVLDKKSLEEINIVAINKDQVVISNKINQSKDTALIKDIPNYISLKPTMKILNNRYGNGFVAIIFFAVIFLVAFSTFKHLAIDIRKYKRFSKIIE